MVLYVWLKQMHEHPSDWTGEGDEDDPYYTPATCTEYGYWEYGCADCGETIVEIDTSEERLPQGHKFGVDTGTTDDDGNPVISPEAKKVVLSRDGRRGERDAFTVGFDSSASCAEGFATWISVYCACGACGGTADSANPMVVDVAEAYIPHSFGAESDFLLSDGTFDWETYEAAMAYIYEEDINVNRISETDETGWTEYKTSNNIASETV